MLIITTGEDVKSYFIRKKITDLLSADWCQVTEAPVTTPPDGILKYFVLTLVLLSPDISCFSNSVDLDQLASEEAN